MSKAKKALNGYTVPINTNEEAIDVLDEIAELLEEDFTGAEIFKEATQYCRGAEIKYLSVSVVECEDMILIGLPMTTEEDEEPFDILDENGVFGYVYNVIYPECSELGYSFYVEFEGELVRVG